MKWLGTAPEGSRLMGGAMVLAAAGAVAAIASPGFWTGLGALGAGIVCCLVVFFFRDPVRTVPTRRNAIVAAADGHVVSVASVDFDNYIKDKAVRVSTFLSVFDAHVNRTPIDGTVEFTRYQAGRFLPAFQPAASACNEQMAVGVRAGRRRVCIRQIAGIVARRIICHLQPGDRVVRGARYGMIKFGSRMDMILPASAEVLVRPGQHILAGETIVGVFRD